MVRRIVPPSCSPRPLSTRRRPEKRRRASSVQTLCPALAPEAGPGRRLQHGCPPRARVGKSSAAMVWPASLAWTTIRWAIALTMPSPRPCSEFVEPPRTDTPELHRWPPRHPAPRCSPRHGHPPTAAGVAPRVVMEILGHSQISITMTRVHARRAVHAAGSHESPACWLHQPPSSSVPDTRPSEAAGPIPTTRRCAAPPRSVLWCARR
jgi:hypothetical protein